MARKHRQEEEERSRVSGWDRCKQLASEIGGHAAVLHGFFGSHE